MPWFYGKRDAIRPALLVMSLWTAIAMIGCAAMPKKAEVSSTGSANDGVELQAEPIRILRDTLARCEALSSYEVVFHRRESRGLFGLLSNWERIRIYVRNEPFAVKMVWLDSDSEYREAVYVAGANDGKVLVLPRHGLFGLPATPAAYPPQAAVQWGKSLRPITDSGLLAMMQRTLAKIEQAERIGGARIEYAGKVRLVRTSRLCDHFLIEYPPGFTRAARQDLYVDVETHLPAGTYLWLPDQRLLAAYLYEPPLRRTLSADIFRLSD